MNNYLPNLKWGTIEENTRDMVLHGSLKGIKNKNSIFNKEDLRFIINSRLSGTEIAKILKADKSTICRIKSGTSYKNIWNYTDVIRFSFGYIN